MALANSPGVKFTPSPSKTPTPLNYLGGDDFDFIRTELPELYNKLYNGYGSQEVCGMLELMGKEMPFASDNIKWKEEGRLTQLGTGVTRASNVFTLVGHSFRVDETIMVRDETGTVFRQGLIEATTADTFTALCGNAAGWSGTSGLVVYADSNEHKKKTDGMQQSLNSLVESFEQNPVIIKEMVDESGSNLAQIGWIEIEGVDGGVGNVWYFKNKKDTETRFKNAIESKLIRGKKWEASSDLLGAGYIGTQGMFDAFSEGNVFSGVASELADFDEIFLRLDKQGQFAVNYMYNTTQQSLAFDDFLKVEQLEGLSWGAFDNKKDMALNLGFTGFQRAGYEISKSRWRFLTNATTEGSMVGVGKVHAVMFPSASKQVQDVYTGEAPTLPMLHVRYRANDKTNRKYKVSVRSFDQGTSSGVDSVTVDFLTERCLVVLGRNNTVIFKG
jgi:hypothetical protein